VTELDREASKRAYVDRWKHVLGGIVLDAATVNRAGAELSLWIRTVLPRIDSILAQQHDGFFPPQTLPVKPENGQPEKIMTSAAGSPRPAAPVTPSRTARPGG
jgi:hypothetical protein